MREAVFEAADAIAARGEKVTQQAVRDAIGGGSFSSIGPLVRAWREANPAAERSRYRTQGDDLPDVITKVVQELARQVWGHAREEASIGLEAARRELEEARIESERELQEAGETVAVVEGERDQVMAGLADIQEQLRKAHGKIASDEREITRLEERVRAAQDGEDGLKEELRRANLRTDEIKGQMSAFHVQIAGLTAERDAANAAVERAEARSDRLQDELSKTQTDLGGSRSDLSTERAQHGATKEKLTEARKELERREADLAIVREAEAAARVEQEATAKTNLELVNRIQELENQLTAPSLVGEGAESNG